VCTAKLRDYRLTFTGSSPRWGGGVATIQYAKRSTVVGVLWWMSTENLERLDEFEGYPYVYDRVPIVVERLPGKELWCHTYVKSTEEIQSTPSPEYLRTILDGYSAARASVPAALKRLYSQVNNGLTA
jgi:hypothetical protein